MAQQQTPQRVAARAFIAVLPAGGQWQVHRVGTNLIFVDATGENAPLMLLGDSLASLEPHPVPVAQVQGAAE